MYAAREEERRIWNDAYQLRRQYAYSTKKDGHGLCAMIVQTTRFQQDHKHHPMAELLADAMRDEIKSLWAADHS